jgi:hypothetical protein
MLRGGFDHHFFAKKFPTFNPSKISPNLFDISHEISQSHLAFSYQTSSSSTPPSSRSKQQIVNTKRVSAQYGTEQRTVEYH